MINSIFLLLHSLDIYHLWIINYLCLLWCPQPFAFKFYLHVVASAPSLWRHACYPNEVISLINPDAKLPTQRHTQRRQPTHGRSSPLIIVLSSEWDLSGWANKEFLSWFFPRVGRDAPQWSEGACVWCLTDAGSSQFMVASTPITGDFTTMTFVPPVTPSDGRFCNHAKTGICKWILSKWEYMYIYNFLSPFQTLNWRPTLSSRDRQKKCW